MLDILEATETVAAIEKMGGRAWALAVDVASAAQVRGAVAQIVDRFSRLDIVVNNAGIIERTSLENLDEMTLQRELDVILKGTHFMTQSAYSVMRAQGGGKIVNISSISGKLGGAVSSERDAPRGRSGAGYAAAKGAVIAYTKWVAKDAGRFGICVNAVCPGPIATEMTQGFDYGVGSQPLARMGQPNDIAMAVLFLASQMSNYVTGQTLNVDGGILMD